MITIDTKPHMRTEHFRGVITMMLSEDSQPSYTFELLRHTNGAVRYDVVIDSQYNLSPEHHRILTQTIMANFNKGQVDWRPQEKEAKS